MAVKENVKSKRDLLGERLSGKYPDRDFSDDEAMFGQIYDDYDDYDNQLNGYKEREQSMSDMFTKDPRSAQFLTDWRDGQDPVLALLEHFGPDIVGYINDPENKEKVAKASEAYNQRMLKTKELDDEYGKNLPVTLQNFDDAVKDGVLSADKVDDAYSFVKRIIDEGNRGLISRETIGWAVKAMNHDADVEDAGMDGEARGRNARIEEKLRRSKRGDGSANLGGKAVGVGGRKPASMGALDRFGSETDIWERGRK